MSDSSDDDKRPRGQPKGTRGGQTGDSDSDREDGVYVLKKKKTKKKKEGVVGQVVDAGVEAVGWGLGRVVKWGCIIGGVGIGVVVGSRVVYGMVAHGGEREMGAHIMNAVRTNGVFDGVRVKEIGAEGVVMGRDLYETGQRLVKGEEGVTIEDDVRRAQAMIERWGRAGDWVGGYGGYGGYEDVTSRTREVERASRVLVETMTDGVALVGGVHAARICEMYARLDGEALLAGKTRTGVIGGLKELCGILVIREQFGGNYGGCALNGKTTEYGTLVGKVRGLGRVLGKLFHAESTGLRHAMSDAWDQAISGHSNVRISQNLSSYFQTLVSGSYTAQEKTLGRIQAIASKRKDDVRDPEWLRQLSGLIDAFADDTRGVLFGCVLEEVSRLVGARAIDVQVVPAILFLGGIDGYTGGASQHGSWKQYAASQTGGAGRFGGLTYTGVMRSFLERDIRYEKNQAHTKMTAARAGDYMYGAHVVYETTRAGETIVRNLIGVGYADSDSKLAAALVALRASAYSVKIETLDAASATALYKIGVAGIADGIVADARANRHTRWISHHGTGLEQLSEGKSASVLKLLTAAASGVKADTTTTKMAVWGPTDAVDAKEVDWGMTYGELDYEGHWMQELRFGKTGVIDGRVFRLGAAYNVSSATTPEYATLSDAIATWAIAESKVGTSAFGEFKQAVRNIGFAPLSAATGILSAVGSALLSFNLDISDEDTALLQGLVDVFKSLQTPLLHAVARVPLAASLVTPDVFLAAVNVVDVYEKARVAFNTHWSTKAGRAEIATPVTVGYPTIFLEAEMKHRADEIQGRHSTDDGDAVRDDRLYTLRVQHGIVNPDDSTRKLHKYDAGVWKRGAANGVNRHVHGVIPPCAMTEDEINALIPAMTVPLWLMYDAGLAATKKYTFIATASQPVQLAEWLTELETDSDLLALRILYCDGIMSVVGHHNVGGILEMLGYTWTSGSSKTTASVNKIDAILGAALKKPVVGSRLAPTDVEIAADEAEHTRRQNIRAEAPSDDDTDSSGGSTVTVDVDQTASSQTTTTTTPSGTHTISSPAPTPVPTPSTVRAKQTTSSQSTPASTTPTPTPSSTVRATQTTSSQSASTTSGTHTISSPAPTPVPASTVRATQTTSSQPTGTPTPSAVTVTATVTKTVTQTAPTPSAVTVTATVTQAAPTPTPSVVTVTATVTATPTATPAATPTARQCADTVVSYFKEDVTNAGVIAKVSAAMRDDAATPLSRLCTSTGGACVYLPETLPLAFFLNGTETTCAMMSALQQACTGPIPQSSHSHACTQSAETIIEQASKIDALLSQHTALTNSLEACHVSTDTISVAVIHAQIRNVLKMDADARVTKDTISAAVAVLRLEASTATSKANALIQTLKTGFGVSDTDIAAPHSLATVIKQSVETGVAASLRGVARLTGVSMDAVPATASVETLSVVLGTSIHSTLSTAAAAHAVLQNTHTHLVNEMSTQQTNAATEKLTQLQTMQNQTNAFETHLAASNSKAAAAMTAAVTEHTALLAESSSAVVRETNRAVTADATAVKVTSALGGMLVTINNTISGGISLNSTADDIVSNIAKYVKRESAKQMQPLLDAMHSNMNNDDGDDSSGFIDRVVKKVETVTRLNKVHNMLMSGLRTVVQAHPCVTLTNMTAAMDEILAGSIQIPEDPVLVHVDPICMVGKAERAFQAMTDDDKNRVVQYVNTDRGYHVDTPTWMSTWTTNRKSFVSPVFKTHKLQVTVTPENRQTLGIYQYATDGETVDTDALQTILVANSRDTTCVDRISTSPRYSCVLEPYRQDGAEATFCRWENANLVEVASKMPYVGALVRAVTAPRQPAIYYPTVDSTVTLYYSYADETTTPTN